MKLQLANGYATSVYIHLFLNDGSHTNSFLINENGGGFEGLIEQAINSSS